MITRCSHRGRRCCYCSCVACRHSSGLEAAFAALWSWLLYHLRCRRLPH